MSLRSRRQSSTDSGGSTSSLRHIFSPKRRMSRRTSRISLRRGSDQDGIGLQRKPSEKRPGSKWYSAQKTLKDLLKQKGNVSAFREFLKSEYSQENLDFWLEAEEYRKLNKELQQHKAKEIFDQYIKENAPFEVNLSERIRRVVEESIETPDAQTFQEAQQQIFHLIENDSYRRFIKTYDASGESS